MAMEYIEVGGACINCVIAIANDDYTGVSDELETAIKAGLERIGQWLIVGEETGFSWSRCVVCNWDFGGHRHAVGYLQELGAPDA